MPWRTCWLSWRDVVLVLGLCRRLARFVRCLLICSNAALLRSLRTSELALRSQNILPFSFAHFPSIARADEDGEIGRHRSAVQDRPFFRPLPGLHVRGCQYSRQAGGRRRPSVTCCGFWKRQRSVKTRCSLKLAGTRAYISPCCTRPSTAACGGSNWLELCHGLLSHLLICLALLLWVFFLYRC